MASLEITQVRSLIGQKANQRATVRSLGLRRIRHTVVQPDRPEIRGMVAKVAHLVQVRYVGAEEIIELQPGQEPKGEGHLAGGHTVADSEITALREAEAEALAVPGSAPGASMVQAAPGLTSVDAPDTPDAISDASDDVANTGVESASELPLAISDPEPAVPADETGPGAQAPQVVDAEQAAAVDDEALADPRGALGAAVAAGDLDPEEAERFTEDETS